MITYSASRIKLYLSCRAQYYDRYVLRKQQDTTDTSSIMGSAIHNAIEHYYTKGYDPIARFTRYINTVYARKMRQGDITGASYTEILSTGREILKTFPFENYNPRAMELDFTVSLTHPITHEHICNIHGYMDMITDYGIIDLKSGKRKPTQAELSRDIQFTLYWYAYSQVYGHAPEYVYWHHLRDQSVLEYKATNMDEKLLYICSVVEKMQKDTFDDVKSGQRICERCAPWCMRKGM